ncbi:MAG: c-type cytochrome [Phycisphaeraceae bacterium]|nr:c-type cytochrome [Phycisphaeraceae bacterium]
MNSEAHKQTASSSGDLSRANMRADPDPNRVMACGTVTLFASILPIILIILLLTLPAPPVPPWSVEAAALGVEPYEIALGVKTFKSTCAVCHGPNGEGMHLLGKPLRNSAFVQSQTDEELHNLLVTGRPIDDPSNTSGALMPPRGAQDVDDERLARVVLYLRAIQEEGAPTASTEAWNLKGREGGASVAAVELTEHSGYDLFVASCSACHGKGAEGMEDLGLPLSTSGFVRASADKDLITFIKSGRPSWDENNTTGVDMPPKGGNPAITDEQLQIIVDYVRAVQEEAMGT